MPIEWSVLLLVVALVAVLSATAPSPIPTHVPSDDCQVLSLSQLIDRAICTNESAARREAAGKEIECRIAPCCRKWSRKFPALDPDDVLQEILAHLIQTAPRVGNKPDRYWIRAALNRFFQLTRELKRENEQFLRGETQQLLLHPSSPDPCTLEEEEIRARVRAALAELPQDQRDIVQRRAFKGQTLEEMEKDLNSNTTTVWRKYHKALTQLRDLLGGLYS